MPIPPAVAALLVDPKKLRAGLAVLGMVVGGAGGAVKYLGDALVGSEAQAESAGSAVVELANYCSKEITKLRQEQAQLGIELAICEGNDDGHFRTD